MELTEKKPIIILIAGKARSGKSTVCQYFKEAFENMDRKVIVSPYTKYLKKYISDITGKEVTEDNKPRDLLQKISSDLIKERLGYHDFFIRRQIEDINIYSYFADVILIPDVRFPNEIDDIKKSFSNVISIGVIRSDFVSDLTRKQQEDITETALDNYTNYDKIIENTSHLNLEKEVRKLITEIGSEKK